MTYESLLQSALLSNRDYPYVIRDVCERPLYSRYLLYLCNKLRLLSQGELENALRGPPAFKRPPMELMYTTTIRGNRGLYSSMERHEVTGEL